MYLLGINYDFFLVTKLLFVLTYEVEISEESQFLIKRWKVDGEGKSVIVAACL